LKKVCHLLILCLILLHYFIDYESILNKRQRLESTDHQDPDEFDINADFDYDGYENLQNEVDVDLMVHHGNFQDDLRMLAVSNSTSFSKCFGAFYCMIRFYELREYMSHI
jgi:hypothetical protein